MKGVCAPGMRPGGDAPGGGPQRCGPLFLRLASFDRIFVWIQAAVRLPFFAFRNEYYCS